MNVVFTLCSNNYLAQAKTLMDSVHKFNPEVILIIGLVDELHTEVDYSFFNPIIIVPVREIGLSSLDELCSKYNIIELNTAVKASYFKYLSNLYGSEIIIYLDPDTKIFTSLEGAFSELETCDFLITPHILTPIPHDGFSPQENLFLNHGIYNLGFIALKTRSQNVVDFLNWWEERTLTLGYARLAEGLFVDQLWINLVPLLFSKVKIIDVYGYNMGPWNLHEREIINQTGAYKLNDGSPLFFYHFSSYNYLYPSKMCKDYYNRYSFNNRPDLINLYSIYHKELLKNQVVFFTSLECLLLNQVLDNPVEEEKAHHINKLVLLIKNITPPVLYKLTKRIARLL